MKMILELLNLNIIFCTLIIIALSLSFYLHALKRFNFSDEGFAVIELIRALKKICPVQTSNKWTLLSLTWSGCFSKNVLLPGFKSYLKLYGTTCAVACSSMYAFSLISDISKWNEWEPSGNLILRQLNSDVLKVDRFMQASYIVGIQRGIQSNTAFYQFLSFPSKCTKWVLFWNAKKFEFMFFLLQPAVSKNSESHCVITHLYSSSQTSPHTSTSVVHRLRNLKGFLSLSQLNIRPLVLLPELPLPKEHPHPVVQVQESNASSIFMLLPLFYYFSFLSKRLKGFELDSKKIHDTKQSVKESIKESPSRKIIGHDKLRRTVSDMSIPVKETLKRIGINQLSDSIPEDMEVIEKTLSHMKQRSASEPCIEKSQSGFSSNFSEEESVKSLPSIKEAEEVGCNDCFDRKDFYCSSTSDFEILDSNQQFLDSRKADYLTQGNYGASVLQTEMMLASQYDRTQAVGNRVAGGWIHSSSHKGIPVLSKNINLKVMRIFSFLCQTDIPVNYKDAWKCVKNPRFRFISDETVKTVQIIDRISESQKLIHVYHEINGILRKESTDFCLLQTEREEKSCYYSVFQSIEYEKCPLMSAVIRGTLKPSGWIVRELTPKSCRVTYLVQILLNSPDNVFIQELTTLVPQSLYNLRQYITSKPK